MDREILRKALRLQICRQCFGAFVQYVQPGYLMGWVHERICAELDRFLQAVVDGKSPRLMLTMPPRHGKTTLASRCFPAYVLGRYPDMSIIATSYSADLASRINRDVQRIMDDALYADLFPESSLSKPQRSTIYGNFLRNSDLFEIVGHKGTYRSTGVGGGITGQGAEILVIDDVIKDHASADSPTIRQSLWDWYTSTLYTRLAPGGGIILINTRWHPIKDDTPVLTAGGWKLHGELEAGDKVFGLDGRLANVVAVGEPVWCSMKAVTRTESVVCGETHPWPVKSRADNNAVVREARTLVGKVRRLPRHAPLDYGQKGELPIDPYWLGLWLGDGAKNAPLIKCWHKYTKHCEGTVYDFYVTKDEYGDLFYHYVRQGLRGALVSLNVLQNKHIPRIYLEASIEDRKRLLAGLVDTDGEYRPESGCVRFSNSNARLYSDVKELVQSLGMVCGRDSIVQPAGTSLHINGKTYKRNFDCRRFSFTCNMELPCLVDWKKPEVKATRDRGIKFCDAGEDAGWGRCIQTDAPDGIYLVGRSLMPTHNCDDLSGRLLEAQAKGEGDEWRVVNFPAIAEADEEHRKKGEALHPERYPLEALERIKQAIGTRDWEALYQQHPVPDGGAIFKDEWLQRTWFPKDLPARFDAVIMSWDLAFKSTDASDFVVGQLVGRYGADYYILDQLRGRWSFTETAAQVKELAERARVRFPRVAPRILIEDKANGPAVIDALKHEVSGIIPVEPDGSKEARAHAVTALFEAGNVLLPDKSLAPWIDEYRLELTRFPSGAHDDQVDATTQALRYLSAGHSLNIAPQLQRQLQGFRFRR